MNKDISTFLTIEQVQIVGNEIISAFELVLKIKSIENNLTLNAIERYADDTMSKILCISSLCRGSYSVISEFIDRIKMIKHKYVNGNK